MAKPDRVEALNTLLALAQTSRREVQWLHDFVENPHLANDITEHCGVIAELLETQTILLNNCMKQVLDIDDKIVEVQARLQSKEDKD